MVKAKKNGYKIIFSDAYKKGKVDVHGRQKYNKRPRTVVVSSHSTKAGAKKGMKEIGKNLGFKRFNPKGSPYKIIDVSNYKITKDRLFGIKLKRRK